MAIQRVNEKHMALTIGAFAAVVHAVWAGIVAAGSGPALVKWLQGIHFMSETTTVTAFNGMTAATLVIATFIIGAILGWLFAKIWNWLAVQRWSA